ncbi:MAG: hypothetical protein RSA90_01840 [Lachnospiraceae bacterium]
MYGIFGFISMACGIYCIYAYMTMKKTGQINTTILLSKDANPKKCRDTAAYLSEMTPKVLVMGIAAILYGGVDLGDAYGLPVGQFFWIVAGIFMVVLIWFAVSVAKGKKKYFPE